MILISVLLFSPISHAEPSFKDTPFYSTPVEEIPLSEVTVTYGANTGILFEQKGKKEFLVTVGKDYKAYFGGSSDYNKKMLIKLASLGIMKNPLSFNMKSYSLIYKKNHSFNLETYAVVPIKYKDTMLVAKDFGSYGNWVLKDINVRRNGEKGKYFIDIMSLTYSPKDKWFDTRVKMNNIFSGNYMLYLLAIDDMDDANNPRFTLKMMNETNDPRFAKIMKVPSKRLAKDIYGTFYFIVPSDGQPYCLSYFSGKAEVSWALYNFLPIAVLRTQVLERVETILENIQYRAEQSKFDKKKKSTSASN